MKKNGKCGMPGHPRSRATKCGVTLGEHSLNRPIRQIQTPNAPVQGHPPAIRHSSHPTPTPPSVPPPLPDNEPTPLPVAIRGDLSVANRADAAKKPSPL